MIRKSNIFLLAVGTALVCLLFLCLVDAPLRGARREPALADQRRMVKELMLTDLCLFTDARYTRHLTQADMFSAFQDHPFAMDHFPSGSLVGPPVYLWMKQYKQYEMD